MAGFVTITVNDNGGGSVSALPSQIQVLFGCASGGTASTGSIYATGSLQGLRDAHGYGPLVEAAALVLQKGGYAITIRLPTNTVGARKAVQFTGTGTSVITTSGNPNDSYFIVFKVITGGTIGISGITFQISLDAGRTFGPILSLGTANTYLIADTGVTLNFAAGTLVAADKAQFQTIEPLWATGGAQTALTTLANSVYASTGWGSMHFVGGTTVGGVTGSDASTIQGYIEALAGSPNFIYTRAFMSARDAAAATTWGGAGETESAWMTAIQTDFSAVAARRLCVGAGHWNTRSAYANNAIYGSPKLRRSVTWSAAARAVTIPAQRMLSRVKDGELDTIVQDPTNDPLDGFIYHDERSTPGLDYLITGSGSRFMSTMTRPRKQGVYVSHPLTMAPTGSAFYLLPFGNVMDVACTIAQEVGQDEIDDEIRVNANGTIYENDAKNIENRIKSAMDATMLNAGMVSQTPLVTVDRSAIISSTKSVPINITVYQKQYVLAETISIQFNNPLVAA